jgi:hypothetical protein
MKKQGRQTMGRASRDEHLLPNNTSLIRHSVSQYSMTPKNFRKSLALVKLNQHLRNPHRVVTN